MSLDSSYDPKKFETDLYKAWESSGVFQPRGEGEPYSILLPPPNVTGTLHMGHAFQHTLQDALIRYHRMRGFDVLWQMGTDHAGIATEMVVARNIGAQGLTRDGLGREGFIEKVWEWKGQSGDTIERQMRRLGTSGDWTRSMFTMDPIASNAVIEAFVRMHEQGLIYRGQRLVNWDPVLKTAISDLEVVNEEEDGFLWSIAYPLSDGSATLVVATTRPETMLGDTAVMVHPEDERYSHLIGKTVTLPLSGREIPVIADAYVDREFGTGVVKVTPAHDFNDYAVGQRHGLPMINIFTPDAAVNDNAPAKYLGLDRYEARKVVLEELEALGLLVETKPHKLQVPRGDRTNQVIEPYLTDQWFVQMDGLAKRGLELVEKGEVRFVPPNWINTYRHWMENIQDWCISRQLWWGHRIPAWYDQWSSNFVARNRDDAYRQQIAAMRMDHLHIEADILERHALGSREDDVHLAEKIHTINSSAGMYALKQDHDVLETWFSSGLWPFSTMGWPDSQTMTARGFDRFVPSSVLVTGFDIIFFWVARMIMLTDHFTGEIPFKDVYITGLVRDKDGQKMSKSKGNVLDPIDLVDGITLEELVAKRTTGLMNPKDAAKIEKATRKEFPDGIPAFGADALRFTIAALATHGRDIKFDLGRAEGYKNFCNKLWNATRFVLMQTSSFQMADVAAVAAYSDTDHWIAARLERTAREAQAHFANYRFDLLAQCLYEFAWNDFCDWYIELSKPALRADEDGAYADPAAAVAAQHTLLRVLERLLSLLHPLIPFVTEELWLQVKPKLGIDETTVMLRPYPQASELGGDYARAESDVEWLKAMVSALRKVRSELNVKPSDLVGLLLVNANASDRGRIERFASQLKFLNRLDRIEFVADGAPTPPAASAVVGELTLLVPLEGLVDLGAERVRLDKEIKRVEAEIGKCKGKLASDTFVQNAPAAVVEQERKRLVDWNVQLEGLAAQRAKLS